MRRQPGAERVECEYSDSLVGGSRPVNSAPLTNESV